MTQIIRFPLERSPGYKVSQLTRQVEQMLLGMRIDRAIEHLDEVADFRGRIAPEEFRRDQIQPA